jgi:hypothetical protein
MNEPELGIAKIADSIGELVTGVPAPIRKNFFRAFGQLCTAAVDIPVAKMESCAAEIRAVSSARIEIIKKEGKVISERLNVPEEYVTKASEKFASKVVKEQLNLDQIGLNAAKNLSEEKYDEKNAEATKEISDDWLNEFESYAKLKSSDEMKFVFGKILSGEIIKPGTFSIRTLRIVSQLDNQAAMLFQTLCSHCIRLHFQNEFFDGRMVSLTGQAGSNSLGEYGLSFGNLNILQEYGLIISDYNSYMDYIPCVANDKMQVEASMRFNSKDYGFVLIDNNKQLQELKLNGVALTASGKELIDIVPKIEVGKYATDLISFFEKKNLKMVEIK